jgi:hypothetical protein
MKKARITTMLSLTGVLVAGSAAALVNTQVLGNPTPRTEIASEITAVLTLPVDSATTVETTVATPPETEPTESTEETVKTVPGTTATTTDFEVDGAGVVTLDTAGDVLRIVGAKPAAGFTVTETRQLDPLHVKVTLQSLRTKVEFTANLLFGKISTAVEATSNVDGSSSSTPNSTPSSGSVSGGGGGGDPTPVTTGNSTHSTSPSSSPTTTDDKGSGKGGGGKGGDDHTDD